MRIKIPVILISMFIIGISCFFLGHLLPKRVSLQNQKEKDVVSFFPPPAPVTPFKIDFLYDLTYLLQDTCKIISVGYDHLNADSRFWFYKQMYGSPQNKIPLISNDTTYLWGSHYLKSILKDTELNVSLWLWKKESIYAAAWVAQDSLTIIAVEAISWQCENTVKK